MQLAALAARGLEARGTGHARDRLREDGWLGRGRRLGSGFSTSCSLGFEDGGKGAESVLRWIDQELEVV